MMSENSPRNSWNHRASLVECAATMYSASAVKRAIMLCFLELQVSVLHPTLNAKPEIEWQWGWEAQSTSVNPWIWGLGPPNVSHKFLVVCRYFITHRIAPQCCSAQSNSKRYVGAADYRWPEHGAACFSIWVLNGLIGTLQKVENGSRVNWCVDGFGVEKLEAGCDGFDVCTLID